MKPKVHFFLLSCLIFTFSCIKREEYPIVPHIEYLGFSINTNGSSETGIFSISFTDGDGDIGLAAGDTLPPFQSGGEFYYNFFMTFYSELNGEYKKIDAPYNMRIPPINPDNFSQNLNGEIMVEIDISILRTVLTSDKLKIEACLLDRALHKSNSIISPEIILP